MALDEVATHLDLTVVPVNDVPVPGGTAYTKCFEKWQRLSVEAKRSSIWQQTLMVDIRQRNCTLVDHQGTLTDGERATTPLP
ncbi:hypothetical protein OK016_21995 [Vibrio chagasii]|nr:hypothetical protein [Vibrio chagasii]